MGAGKRFTDFLLGGLDGAAAILDPVGHAIGDGRRRRGRASLVLTCRCSVLGVSILPIQRGGLAEAVRHERTDRPTRREGEQQQHQP